MHISGAWAAKEAPHLTGPPNHPALMGLGCQCLQPPGPHPEVWGCVSRGASSTQAWVSVPAMPPQKKHAPEPLDAPLSGRTDAQALVAWVWLWVDIPSPRDLVYKWSLPTHPLVGWMGARMPVPQTSQRDPVMQQGIAIGAGRVHKAVRCSQMGQVRVLGKGRSSPRPSVGVGCPIRGAHKGHAAQCTA